MDGVNRMFSKSYPYELMMKQHDALDRLDLRFQWGNYGIRVCRFHHTSFPPGRVVPFHKHSNYEFHFIPRGKGKVILGDVPYALHEGLFYLTGPDVVHYQEADAHESMEELCLHMDIVKLDNKNGTEAQDEEWGRQWEIREAEACISQLDKLPQCPVLDRHKAMECFLVAYKAWHENQLGLFTTIKQAVIQILLRSVSDYSDMPLKGLPNRDMKQHRFQMAVQFIQDNYKQPLTLGIVAERVQLSTRQLQRIFRDFTGGTFSEYIEALRLQRICSELSGTDRTIDRIALENGFMSSNYLHYVFKRKLGTTPLQYRSQYRPE